MADDENRTGSAGRSAGPGRPGRGGGAPGRWAARAAVLAAAGVVAALVFAGGGGGFAVVALTFAALVACAAGVWWFLAHRGPVRALGAVVAVASPSGALALLTVSGMWQWALMMGVCWAAMVGAAREALRRSRPTRPPRTRPAARPRRPVLIMNPKSGGGKVERFGLVARAEALGARVVLLDPSHPVDVTGLARRAVAEGADLLGVAGGDGTQAEVAAVAAEYGLPFLVISAGTRNHFAMDLGLDRTDPARCLDALTDGEELRVDLGFVSGRPFVNTVSFGVYADVVQRPEYRDAKAETALGLLPDLLAGSADHVGARVDGVALPPRQALLVSNNPYRAPDVLGGASLRPRLDTGVLGVLGIHVETAAQAADLALRGAQSPGLLVTTGRRVEVFGGGGSGSGGEGAGGDEIPVAVDGEALLMPSPVVCVLKPRVLRVVLPRTRPGAVPPPPALDWRHVLRLAFNRPVGRGA
ncbi:diacylglycerol/lipid kinase family protein [Streptomyces sp. NPDC002032]|uniref:diacylglycerol/lipid kinase family protein n=1 Tax=Streptomyces sp. NPDC002032 TaxID=3364630 RepID=UPI0036922174